MFGQIFSVANTPEFSNPNAVFGDANFGKVKNTLAVETDRQAATAGSLALGAKITF